MRGKGRRFRLRHVFWLDLNKPEEKELADFIALLKENRLFVRYVRNGLRIVADLEQGKLDSLVALYPFAAKQLATPALDWQPREEQNPGEYLGVSDDVALITQTNDGGAQASQNFLSSLDMFD